MTTNRKIKAVSSAAIPATTVAPKTVAGAATARKAPSKADRGSTGQLSLPAVRTEWLIAAIGNGNTVARLLGVSPSQPSRWRSGKESPGPEAARRIIDLEHVLARARLLWAPDVALVWLESANGYLDGATPLDVLLTRGASEVLDALDAAAAGAYA